MGFEKKVAFEECMTGREFCELIEVDYDSIVRRRAEDQPANFEFLLTAMLKIGPVHEFLSGRISRDS